MRTPPRRVSFILATHDRRAIVSRTLAQLDRCGLDRGDYEVIAVDNASTDGTPEAMQGACDILVRLDRNAGSCAKACVVERAAAPYIVFLDDDSHPRPGSVARMIEHFQDDPQLGAAGFTVHLPDGRKEGSALPEVFLGCGVGFRAEALRQSGGLDRSFFMQAEEYDLAFRLAGTGWSVKTFDDLHVEHAKTPHARTNERITYYDVRNNLRVAARYLPAPACASYRRDWLQRYRWLAKRDRHDRSYRRGARAGRWHGAVERWTYRRRRLAPEVFERFFRWEYIRRRMATLARRGARRIVLADLGKNVFAYYRAAMQNGITILAIGDDRFAARGRRYRGLAVMPLERALGLGADAVVVANSSGVHGTETYHRIITRAAIPAYHWF